MVSKLLSSTSTSALASASASASSASSPRRPIANANNSVRRTLFNHNARYPSTSTSTSATTLQETLQESAQDESFDIVIKDRTGNYDVQIPLLPPLEDEQAREEDTTEKEKVEARLLEMYKNRSLQPGEPAELLGAVQSSLKRTVASLDEDNWIFEANCWPSQETSTNASH